MLRLLLPSVWIAFVSVVLCVGASPALGQDEVVDLTAEGEVALDSAPERASTSRAPAPAPESARVASGPAPKPRDAGSVPAHQGDSNPSVERPNVVSVSPIGVVIGRVRLSYERLLRPRHGVFAEALVSPFLLFDGDFVSYGGALGYRFHWRGPARGPFVGGTLSVEGGQGARQVAELGSADLYVLTGEARALSVLVHAGYRWVFRHGLAITLRGGTGYAHTWIDPGPGSEPDAIRIAEETLPLAVEGEASLGFMF